MTELDGLVGKLLASSRLDFETLSKQSVVASELFVDVLERRTLAPELLEDQTPGKRVQVDPTLIARALDNLLDNAERHAGKATRCRVWIDPGAAPQLVFEVCDDGPGFAAEVLPRVFEAFQRAGGVERAGAASLGLGLSLGAAHRARAWRPSLGGESGGHAARG